MYFNKAMELNADNWRTLCELAKTYDSENDWQKSTELLGRVRLSLLNAISESSDDGPLKEHLHIYLEHMGRPGETIRGHPRGISICTLLLEFYHEIVEKASKIPVPEEDFSELIQFFLGSVFGVEGKAKLAADAALATYDLKFALESLQMTTKVA
ncbi:NACHT and TPR domain protein [Penicillium crustosum]|uniref:NACHT and TPR domain protein n=1 Tax=Penicillium crustosum TaxID=36656 RepID=UPI00238FDCAD|nr:NACHT and TPR domain protein [Penicillium crustosum]KAJ5393902.1 NACHT and TPR domain protein [Penicillium crustosum]